MLDGAWGTWTVADETVNRGLAQICGVETTTKSVACVAWVVGLYPNCPGIHEGCIPCRLAEKVLAANISVRDHAYGCGTLQQVLLDIGLRLLNAPPTAGEGVHLVPNTPALQRFSRSHHHTFCPCFFFGQVHMRSTCFSALDRRLSPSRSRTCCLVLVFRRSGLRAVQNRTAVVVADFVAVVLTVVAVAVLTAVSQQGNSLQATLAVVEEFLQAPVLAQGLLL